MGNCLRSNRGLAEDHNEAPIAKEEEAVKVRTQQSICSTSTSGTPSKLESAKEGKKKKVVRFKLPEEEEEDNKETIINNNSSSGDSNSGVVRIKLVLTREELKQVVNFMNASEDDDHSSYVQQILSVIKSRGQRVSEAGSSCATTARQDLVNGSWSPVLESIAED